LTFRISEPFELSTLEQLHRTEYPHLVKTLVGAASDRGFRLDVDPGSFANGEIIVMLGKMALARLAL